MAHELATGVALPPPTVQEVRAWLLEHLVDHYGLYGEFIGVRTARKHIGWALAGVDGGRDFMRTLNTIDDCGLQLRLLDDWLQGYADRHVHWPALSAAANDEQMQLSA